MHLNGHMHRKTHMHFLHIFSVHRCIFKVPVFLTHGVTELICIKMQSQQKENSSDLNMQATTEARLYNKSTPEK